MKRILFICPHTDVSGGPKVIFRFADFFRKFGAQVTVGVHRLGGYSWTGVSRDLRVIPFDSVNFSEFDVAINFCDGWPERVPIPQVLFLQGYGTQAPAKEERNMRFPWKGVVCTSEWLGVVAKSFGHTNITIVRPWVDNFFHPRVRNVPDMPTLGTIYHATPAKGFGLILSVLRELATKSKGVVVKLVSPKPLGNLATSFNCPKNIIFKEVVGSNQELLAQTYTDCSVWLAAAQKEGFGLPPLEAMACGTPIVMLPTSGLDVLLQGSPARVCSSISDMVANILDVVSSPQKREGISESGVQFLSTYTTQKVEALKFFEFLLGKENYF